jgi:hypothetical protein
MNYARGLLVTPPMHFLSRLSVKAASRSRQTLNHQYLRQLLFYRHQSLHIAEMLLNINLELTFIKK